MAIMTTVLTQPLLRVPILMLLAFISFSFFHYTILLIIITGTNPEDSGDDVGTVQVPSAWRSIVQDTKTMQLLFYYYSECSPPASNTALSAIVQLGRTDTPTPTFYFRHSYACNDDHSNNTPAFCLLSVFIYTSFRST